MPLYHISKFHTIYMYVFLYYIWVHIFSFRAILLLCIYRYYAAPTIHMMLIEEAKRRKNRAHAIRLIANAAGGSLEIIISSYPFSSPLSLLSHSSSH
jgi:hypothetical protein